MYWYGQIAFERKRLFYLDDVKLYEIGEQRYTGCCVSGKSWIALKDGTFLWVEYSGMLD